MYDLKLVVIVAVAVLRAGVVIASDIAPTCLTAPAVTTTVTVTTCGQPTWPAVPASGPSGLGPALPSPAETSWLPSHPETVSESHGLQVPGTPGSASPSPFKPGQPQPAPFEPSEEPSGNSGKPPSESPSGVSSITADTNIPSSSSSQTSETPTRTPWAQPSKEPSVPTNAGSVVSMSVGMGSFIAMMMALSAGILLLL